jgi:NAD(P)H-hydrate epimerase
MTQDTRPPGTELLGVAEMGRADGLAVAAGVPSLDLMEAAGKAVADTIRAHWPRRSVVVLCGPGNNGGDGFVAARYLRDARWPVRVSLLGSRDALKGDAKANADRWAGDIEQLSPQTLAGASLLVDALFGAGLARPLDGEAHAVVAAINAGEVPCVAVDVPSGVHGDTGEVLGNAPRCALTVSFFRRKPGHLLRPGRDLAGEIVVADIGIPDTVLGRIQPKTFVNGPQLWASALRWPDADSHKYTRGHALIIGGERMTGAARLAARAARRVGAGVVTIAAPECAVPIHLAGDPGQLVIALSENADMEAVVSERKRTAVLMGPGNETGAETRRRVIGALRSEAAVVLDAGALTTFADDPRDLFGWIKGHTRRACVLTPHDGEFARLFDVAGDRLTRCRRAAQESHAVVLLKGNDTVIAAPDGRAAISEASSPWLATAGTGDVLSGVIVGLLAQGVAPFEAACAGAWMQAAGAERFGPGLIAEDIADQLPGVVADLYKSR